MWMHCGNRVDHRHVQPTCCMWPAPCPRPLQWQPFPAEQASLTPGTHPLPSNKKTTVCSQRCLGWTRAWRGAAQCQLKLHKIMHFDTLAKHSEQQEVCRCFLFGEKNLKAVSRLPKQSSIYVCDPIFSQQK